MTQKRIIDKWYCPEEMLFGPDECVTSRHDVEPKGGRPTLSAQKKAKIARASLPRGNDPEMNAGFNDRMLSHTYSHTCRDAVSKTYIILTEVTRPSNLGPSRDEFRVLTPKC